MHTAMTRTEPPAPRSQQLKAAAAAAAAGLPATMPPPPRSVPPTASLSRASSHHGAGSMMMMNPAMLSAAGPGQIDLAKYRTKMCRNYQLGQHCPWEDRCVFAHGEGQLLQGSENATPATPVYADQHCGPHSTTSAFSGSLEFPSMPGSAGYNMTAANSSDDDACPTSPPTYQSFLATSGSMGPAYGADASGMAPSRYRFDPYSVGGIVYCNFKYLTPVSSE